MINAPGNTADFINKAMGRLYEENGQDRMFPEGVANSSTASAVLFLIGTCRQEKKFPLMPCLILNKRSLKVKQAGDLCCPGGGISSRMDAFLSKLLYLPGTPLTRWPYWQTWHKHRRRDAQNLAILLAACLREGLEEMRLNPLGVKFLGPLPSQKLTMFQRVIYPMVCRLGRQKRFITNREVDKIVYIPFKDLLNPAYYARYRVKIETSLEKEKHPEIRDFPCFIHHFGDYTEVLWGATFRIAMVFLEIVFNFKPPDMASLPIVFRSLDKSYLTGNG
ncbi:MAG: CoA pyrophosphatase [Desulfobacterales bacterium]